MKLYYCNIYKEHGRLYRGAGYPSRAIADRFKFKNCIGVEAFCLSRRDKDTVVFFWSY